MQWEPGKAHGYHVLTFGHIVGELIERISGEPLNQFIQTIIFEDEKNSCFTFGINEKEKLLADIQEPVGGTSLGAIVKKAKEVGSMGITSFNDPMLLTAPIVNSGQWKSSLMPGANGFSSAIALVETYKKMIDRDNSVFAVDHLEKIIAVASTGKDETLKQDTTWSLGFQLNGGAIRFGSLSGMGSRNFGHYGIYGSVAFADPDRKIAFSYVKNQCGEPDDHSHAHRLMDALYQSL